MGQIERRLKGLELDPHAAGFAQTALDLLLSPLSRAAGRPAPRVVEVADTLERAPQAEYDLVIGNPPYGRIRLTPEQRQRYARSLYGHANLYGVFTDIALRWTKPKGVVAYLTPTSVLGGQYFAANVPPNVNSAPRYAPTIRTQTCLETLGRQSLPSNVDAIEKVLGHIGLCAHFGLS